MILGQAMLKRDEDIDMDTFQLYDMEGSIKWPSFCISGFFQAFYSKEKAAKLTVRASEKEMKILLTAHDRPAKNRVEARMTTERYSGCAEIRVTKNNKYIHWIDWIDTAEVLEAFGIEFETNVYFWVEIKILRK